MTKKTKLLLAGGVLALGAVALPVAASAATPATTSHGSVRTTADRIVGTYGYVKVGDLTDIETVVIL